MKLTDKQKKALEETADILGATCDHANANAFPAGGFFNLNDVFNYIYAQRMTILRNENREAKIIILGAKTYNDILNCREAFERGIYNPRTGIDCDDTIFGIRVVVSNRIDEITVI